jgi:hypothetical protein
MMTALVAIVGFIIASGLLRTRSTPPEGDEASAAGPPKFQISNIENAVFDSKVEGGTVHSSLTRGTAAFHVERLGPRHRFLLTLPDGDLEVRGTRFVVTVEGEKTREVDVAEGTVVLRLRGRAEMLLSAGERWPSESGRQVLLFNRPPIRDAAPPAPSKSKSSD